MHVVEGQRAEHLVGVETVVVIFGRIDQRFTVRLNRPVEVLGPGSLVGAVG